MNPFHSQHYHSFTLSNKTHVSCCRCQRLKLHDLYSRTLFFPEGTNGGWQKQSEDNPTYPSSIDLSLFLPVLYDNPIKIFSSGKSLKNKSSFSRSGVVGGGCLSHVELQLPWQPLMVLHCSLASERLVRISLLETFCAEREWEQIENEKKFKESAKRFNTSGTSSLIYVDERKKKQIPDSASFLVPLQMFVKVFG